MKKQVVSIILLVALCFSAFVVSGCGSLMESGRIEETDSTVKETYDKELIEAYDGKPVTIRFYHTMSATKLQPVLDEYIKEFNKMFPNITVEHSAPGSYDDVLKQINTELTAGNQPNIAYCYPDHVAGYNIAKAVVPLDAFIESTVEFTDALGNKHIIGLTEEQINDFIPGYYAEGTAFDKAGTMYTLPMSKSTEALYYNKTVFEKHGLKVPTTWDEMEQVCRKLKELYPNSIPLGYDSEANWFITMCEQYGSVDGKNYYTQLDKENYFLFDNDVTRGFVEKFRQWHQDGLVTTEEIYGAYTSGLFTEADPTKQNCFMVIGSTGGASYQTPPTDAEGKSLFETDMATIPQINPENPKVISQGPSLCIFNDTNPQEVVASWLFVKFLTTNVDFQAAFSMKSGYAPVIKSAQNNETYKKWLDSASGKVTEVQNEDGTTKLIPANVTALSVKLALAQADAYYVSAAFNGSSTAREQVGIIMQTILVYEGNDVKKAIDDAFKRAIGLCANAAY